MGAMENTALMALAGSLAKLEVRVSEGVELLKDILSCLEGDDTSDGADTSPIPGTAAIPTTDMNAFMEGMLKNAMASNPALGLALQALKSQQSSGTNNGGDEKKEG